MEDLLRSRTSSDSLFSPTSQQKMHEHIAITICAVFRWQGQIFEDTSPYAAGNPLDAGAGGRLDSITRRWFIVRTPGRGIGIDAQTGEMLVRKRMGCCCLSHLPIPVSTFIHETCLCAGAAFVLLHGGSPLVPPFLCSCRSYRAGHPAGMSAMTIHLSNRAILYCRLILITVW